MVDYTRVGQLWFVHFPQAEAGWIFQLVVVAVGLYYYYLWKKNGKSIVISSIFRNLVLIKTVLVANNIDASRQCILLFINYLQTGCLVVDSLDCMVVLV